ncbi:MAG: methylenetetrahydrofolate reductase C-terminal domain-containing protein [Deltaproteobacteria bacterium]|nr:methylenetetrahydrofolate reductase C-terminal domain-containing protein [Deltaproteobacteria bacterium]
MIITKKKAAKDILDALKGSKSVFLFGCDTCAEQCSTGGKKELDEMKALLEENGIKVTGSSLPEVTCYRQYIVKEFKGRGEIASADALLVLACGAGVRTVADVAPEATPVIPALDSLYLATVERFGRFLEGCAMCGECVLADTGGICPHTECPKGLLNGPCGGVADGMCEVDTAQPCAWVRIYNRLKEQGRLHLMKKVRPPKSHANNVKPRKTFLRSYEREIVKKPEKK